MNRLIAILLFLTIILSSAAYAARPLEVPSTAVEIAPDTYSLGKARMPDGKIVDGIMFVNRRQGAASKGVGGKPGGSACYSYIASGAKWKSVEPYVVGTSNNDNLSSSFVLSTVAQGMSSWDGATSGTIFGALNTTGTTDGIDTSSPDGKNEIFFGQAADSNTIAVTTVWGIFYGPSRNRQIVEFDLLYNDAYVFGDAGPTSETTNAAVSFMDFEGITTHELGHALGLGHPSSSCSEETMYAYASYGETKKRTLNTGDIAGVKSLYG